MIDPHDTFTRPLPLWTMQTAEEEYEFLQWSMKSDAAEQREMPHPTGDHAE